jgi:2-methylisocitrate lyase-like PEP mutase family enzyme
MDRSTQRALAERLLALHVPGRPLILVNVWDVASALVVQRAGFPAIATSSSAVASALGYPDGEQIPPHEMLAAVARIVARASVPVTADLEAGYADDPAAVAEVVHRLLETGAVGLNLEDGIDAATGSLRSVEAAADRIRAVREAGDEHGLPLVINARTDVFLEDGRTPDDLLTEAIARLSVYRAAGADSLFPIGVRDPTAIRRLVQELRHPVNVLAGPGAPSVIELGGLGVARISLGGGPQRTALAALAAVAEEVRDRGTYGAMHGMVSHQELDQLVADALPASAALGTGKAAGR